MPDRRWQPLTLFTVVDDQVHYLGSALDLDLGGSDRRPRIERMRLPQLAYQRSSALEWGLAIDLIAPFLAAILSIAQVEIDVSLNVKQHRQTRVRLSLGRTTRAFIAPVACASWLERNPIRLPQNLDLHIDGKSQAIYIIDSTLYSKELSILVEGGSGAEFTVSLEASLLGKLQPQSLLRSETRLVITGTDLAPFALTCFEAYVDETGRLKGIRLPEGGPRAAATDVALMSDATHVVLGQGNELVQFDE
jgi:hypothetical protein